MTEAEFGQLVRKGELYGQGRPDPSFHGNYPFSTTTPMEDELSIMESETKRALSSVTNEPLKCVRCGGIITPDERYWNVNYKGRHGPLCEDCASDILD